MRHGNIFPTDRSLPSMRARFNGHALKGQKFIAQRQAKRRPGYNVAVQVAPCKGKSAETERFMFTFALTGRGVMWRFTQGVASLALGYELLPLQGVPVKTRPHRR